MARTLEEIELRSEEVQEVLNSPPSWLYRWGLTVIFLLGLLLLGITWLIKYPDIIPGKIILTTQNPPIKIVANSSGKLVNLFKTEGQFLSPHEVVAEIENPITQQGIGYIEKLVLQVKMFLKNSSVRVNFTDSSYVFGSIQAEYNELKKQCLDYHEWTISKYKKDEIVNLKQKIQQYNHLIKITEKQFSIAQSELKNAEEKYKTDQMLFREGVLAKLQFFQEESAFRQKQMEIENLKKSATQNRITLIDLEKQLMDMEHQQREEERNFQENISLNLHAILNQIETWQKSYLITTPIGGQLSYLKQINKNQFIQTGDFIFAVVPESEEYIGIMDIPTQGFGKVKVGQKVRIKFDNYPHEEYGQVDGTIKRISQMADDNAYRAEVELMHGLKSSYNKQLDFTPEMTGLAEIVTEDISLLERIFYIFRKVLNND